MKINLQKKNFKDFLQSLSSVNDVAILEQKDGDLLSFMGNEDNSLHVIGRYFENFEDEFRINCPSLKKLSNLINSISEDDFELKINRNNLEYRGELLKFRYHLHEDGLITQPKTTISKIENFDFDVDFEIEDKKFISDLFKHSSNVDSNKAYLYTEDNKLYWSLEDRTMDNTDVYTVCFGTVDFDLEESFIISLDNLKLMKFFDKIRFKINKKIGVGSIITYNDNFSINYTFPSLAQ